MSLFFATYSFGIISLWIKLPIAHPRQLRDARNRKSLARVESEASVLDTLNPVPAARLLLWHGVGQSYTTKETAAKCLRFAGAKPELIGRRKAIGVPAGSPFGRIAANFADKRDRKTDCSGLQYSMEPGRAASAVHTRRIEKMKVAPGSEPISPGQSSFQRNLSKHSGSCCRNALQFLALLASSLFLFGLDSRAADSDLPAAPAVKVEETNSLETLRSYLQLQEQLHATQLAIEENRKEANAAAARGAETLANRLQAIEQSLAGQRARELEAMQSSNRLMLTVAGGIAVLGLAAMVLMAYSHWRAMSRLADIATAFPTGRGLGGSAPLAALGPGDAHVVSVGPGPAEQSNGRLLGAIDRLEKRIYELEHTTQSSVKEKASEEARPEPSNGNGESS